MLNHVAKRRLCRALSLVVIAGTLVSSVPLLEADSILNFPRLSHDTDTLTGVAIVNPTSQEAVVTLTAYGVDGQMLEGVAQSVPVTVPANQQLSRLTTELFGDQLDPSTVGWFQATSAVDGLTGFFLFLNSSSTRFDGADLPLSATSIVFNQVRVDATHTTELNIINPGSAPANLSLQLVDGGSSVPAKPLSLSAMGVARLDAATFFGVGQTNTNAYVRVDADVAIAGFEFIQEANGDLLGLNAQDASAQLRNLFFPQLAVLAGWKTELGLINYSSQPVIVSISAFKPGGELYDTADLQGNPVTRSLAGGESLVEDVESMFGFSGTQTRDGWLRVESTEEAINGFVSYGVPGSGSIASVAASGNGQKLSIFSHIATTAGFFTGVAFLNSGQLATNIRVLAIKPTADVLGSFNTVLQPGERQSRLVNELISAAADQAGGLIWVKSNLPIHLTSLFGGAAILANIPPQPAPTDYQPDAGLPSVEVSPQLAILQPGATETFQLVGVTGDVDWKINGLSGGNQTFGTITGAGLYQAPASVPDPAVITVTAEADSQVAGASVDVLEKEKLLSSSLIVQSVAYLESLKTLYTAELEVLSGADEGPQPLADRPAQGTTNSEIFSVDSSGNRLSLTQFPGEKIAKMIPFRASNGTDFLLLAAETSGRIIRLGPDPTPATTDVATGLNQPHSIVLDTSSNSLLVAEQDKISTIPRVQLELGLSSQGRTSGIPAGPEKLDLFPVQRADSVVVDRCSGNIFFSNRDTGEIIEYVLRTGTQRTVISDLSQPTQLLAIFRSGIGCPDSFHLLINEQGLDRVLLSVPRRNFARRWIEARQGTDLAFLPARTPFADGGEAILLPEAAGGQPAQQAGGSELSAVPVRRNYQNRPVNPPPPPPAADEPGPGGVGELSVTMTITSNAHFSGVCPQETTTVDVSVLANAQGKLESRDGSLTLRGTFSGTEEETCQTTGTVGDECIGIEDCSFQGDFTMAITPVEPSDPTNLGGTWDMTLQGSERCVGGFGVDDAIFDFRATFQVSQVGDQLSGSFLGESAESNLDIGVPITCSQPGQCEFDVPGEGTCTLTCDPATADCAQQFQLSGTVTTTSN